MGMNLILLLNSIGTIYCAFAIEAKQKQRTPWVLRGSYLPKNPRPSRTDSTNGGSGLTFP